MQAARDRQKSYADLKRKPMEFQVGDKVMLKVSPWKGVVHIGKTGECHADEPLAVLLDGLHLEDKLHFVEEPLEIGISRDDLTELYMLVMQKYGTNGPEDEYERVFWGDLKTMFDPPLSTDPVWNLPYQQKMLRWRYYDTCRVHCLTLESADIYMLTERRYPIPADVCQAMLDKKLQGDKKDEACYQLLKLIEKQAQNKLP
ncbi:hypothetical protein Tco_1387167 [Tanacetum coccineum]